MDEVLVDAGQFLPENLVQEIDDARVTLRGSPLPRFADGLLEEALDALEETPGQEFRRGLDGGRGQRRARAML